MFKCFHSLRCQEQRRQLVRRQQEQLLRLQQQQQQQQRMLLELQHTSDNTQQAHDNETRNLESQILSQGELPFYTCFYT